MRLSDYSIGTRALGAFGILVALFIALGAISYLQIEKVYSGVTDLGMNWMPSLDDLGNMQYSATRTRVSVVGRIANATPDTIDKQMERLKTYRQDYDKDAKHYESLLTGAEERALYDKVKAAMEVVRAGEDKVISLVRQNKRDEALALALGAASDFDLLSAALEADKKFQKAGAAKALEDSSQVNSMATVTVLIAVLLAVVTAVGSYLMITNTVTHPVNVLTGVMESLAKGKLAVTIP